MWSIILPLDRLQLAGLHFNENASCEHATTSDGEARYEVIFPKYKKGDYVVNPRRACAARVTVHFTCNPYMCAFYAGACFRVYIRTYIERRGFRTLVLFFVK